MAERVDAGNADAVQAAGNFVGRGVELAAGVQHGHDDLGRRQPLAIHIHFVDWNAAAVVDHGDGVIDEDRYIDTVGKARQRFIDGVVDNFVDEMMQTHLAGRPDVHGGALADGFHAAKNLDGIGGVFSVRLAIAVLPVFRGQLFIFSFNRLEVFWGRRSGCL